MVLKNSSQLGCVLEARMRKLVILICRVFQKVIWYVQQV